MTLSHDLPSTPAAQPRIDLEPTDEFLALGGEGYYRISSYHRLQAFLMNLVSDTDLWMFITSNGGLTAGRVDADGGLFPYEAVDKLHDGHHHTGPTSLFRVKRGKGPRILWRPFSERAEEDFCIERSLYKNSIGNKVVFEETNLDLGLAFRYSWSGCDEFGHVRTATLANLGSGPVEIAMLDGLRNILPYGVPLALYRQSSSLVDAYKRSEYDADSGMGIFSLTAKILDRAEPAEELRANTVWCSGLGNFTVCLSIDGVKEFRRGNPAPVQQYLSGSRGNYLVLSEFALEAGEHQQWYLVADVGRSHVQLETLRHRLMEDRHLAPEIENAIRKATDNLSRIVGSADGLQLTGCPKVSAHHFANALFNTMRGGVFVDNERAPSLDFARFLRTRNRILADRHQAFLGTLPTEFSTRDLLASARTSGDPDLQRLCHEYLPIYFSRRHGDPSRPWNRFEIRVRNPDGSRVLHYEGNWRDIFQNWEALSLSYPGFLPRVIAKFVNASTVDGFNPYRIGRDGVEWEIDDPDDPWSYIGYWGDHQIIYLLKFLEALTRFWPGRLEGLLAREIFCYTDVPYRLKPYKEIVENPRSTITYDGALAARIEEQVRSRGTDGKLLRDRAGSVYHVNLFEKLLVPALSKLSNLVPDGGIWMNTQRPEWNDANNALAGTGLSMVTLCYLRRYLWFLKRILEAQGGASERVSTEIVRWTRSLQAVLDKESHLLTAPTLHDTDRRRILDALGETFSEYRRQVYEKGFSGKEDLPFPEVAGLFRCALQYLDHAIRANRREDGLYHSYNLLEISNKEGKATIRPLYEMLEGQVAALSSGLVDKAEAVQLLSILFKSRLFRRDQRSFLLYPERELPGFRAKNVVPEERVRALPLLVDLIQSGETSVLSRDAFGTYRFHGDFSNGRDLAGALDRLGRKDRWVESVSRDRQKVLDLFEEVFHHRSFTGRSGTMYGYEGLGCIYWHMVSKLLLAVQELTLEAAREDHSAFRDLAGLYYRIRAGLGFEKRADEFGAFPTDPYSHTPLAGGARQPGMTGQVKEEILTRFGELGMEVSEGSIHFRPALLTREEFLREGATFHFYDLKGMPAEIEVPAGALAFTYCQVPVVYELGVDEPWIRVTNNDGVSTTRQGDRLDPSISHKLFHRLGGISRIDVGVPESLVFTPHRGAAQGLGKPQDSLSTDGLSGRECG